MLHKQKNENNDKSLSGTSGESHFQWQKRFPKNSLYFRKYQFSKLIMKLIVLV